MGCENQVANHWSHLESNEVCNNKFDINEEFLYELVMDMLEKGVPWYVDFANYIVCQAHLEDLMFHQNKKFLQNVKWYY